MGGGTIMQQWGIGVSIFPPVCTGSQNPQNYFTNTYVLPSVNRTAGPIRYKLRIGLKANRSSYLSRGIFVQISVALTPTLCVEKRKLCLIIDQSQGKKKRVKGSEILKVVLAFEESVVTKFCFCLATFLSWIMTQGQFLKWGVLK